MPEVPLPRPGQPRELDESWLDMILNGQSLPPDAPQEMHALAEALADVAGPAEAGNLPGEGTARFAFTRRRASPAGVSPAARPAKPRRSRLSALLSTRLAVVLVAAAVVLGCTAAVYAGVLPGPVQDFAHRVIGAPPAHRADSPTPHHGKSGTRGRREGQPGNGKSGRRQAHAAPTATAGEGKGHGTAPSGTAVITCPPGTKANFRWHYGASGSPGGWSGTQSAVCPGSLAMGPQAMGGDLKVSPGTTLEAGYDFTVPGNHASFSLTVGTPRVVFAVACVSGATPPSSTFTVPMPTRTYSVAGDQWYPSGGQGGALVYQGSAAVPELCGGGQLSLDQGGTFLAGQATVPPAKPAGPPGPPAAAKPEPGKGKGRTPAT